MLTRQISMRLKRGAALPACALGFAALSVPVGYDERRELSITT